MMSTPPRRVAVVGAGIGGLALARALKTLDTGVEEIAVFDRREELRPNIGGGIQINGGAAVLARLGLGDQMKASALPVKRILSRKSGGFELLDIDVASLVSAEPALVGADGTPQAFSIMRDALQRILVDGLPEGTLRLGRRLIGIDEGADGVELTFEDGTSERFDLVVGADGLSSKVREHVEASHADADGVGVTPPSYSGIRVQFGVVPDGGSRPAGSSGEFHQWFGEGVYALTGSYGTGAADGSTSDMVAVVFADPASASGEPPENSNWEVRSLLTTPCASLPMPERPHTVMAHAECPHAGCLSHTLPLDCARARPYLPISHCGALRRMLATARDAPASAALHLTPCFPRVLPQVSDVRDDCVRRLQTAGIPAEVVTVAQKSERCFELGVYEHSATAPWVSKRGHAVLLGDAAHAMAPFLGQGANQAIQDGYCLADRLAAANNGGVGSKVVGALQSYTLLRRAPVTALQIESRLLGAMETAGGGPGTLPQIVRDAFFFVNGKLGIAAQVFVKGARPWV